MTKNIKITDNLHHRVVHNMKRDNYKFFIGIILTLILLIIVGVIAYSKPSAKEMSVDNQIEYGDLQNKIIQKHKSSHTAQLIQLAHKQTIPCSCITLLNKNRNDNDTEIKIFHDKYKCEAHSSMSLIHHCKLTHAYKINHIYPVINMHNHKRYLLKI